ncbi:Crp/Fnr family transcriptional regulator [Spirochaeta thermophila]|uniref:Transcriptional regulatory protein n=1 Tax=Winmispira thermophila (strain ATCC 49972 / DSM 6192 / RI 19.B1) TaxID=665571 RepID=E0RPH4_WINT6|nr:cyclic nucleotide-binding domain-containing protein [Spirochaeta thermophila]ADN02756.1 transcriptional regulatory protein [Spirochaeta thermophila DSM 6192]
MAEPLQLSLVNFRKGAYIIVEGKQDADYFYIIRSGQVRLARETSVVDDEGGDILGPGDFFGVVATMSRHSHIETAQALTDVSLIAVHRDNYHLLIERNTPVALKIIEKFSRQMRHLDRKLSQLTLKHTIEEYDLEHLFRVGEYYVRQNQYSIAYYAYYQYLKYAPQGRNVEQAKARMEKIKPYARPVFLEPAEGLTRTYPKDTMIFCENMPGEELFVIQKGSVRITKIVNDREVLLAVLKPGDIFGEMALLENKPRSASAIAHEDCTLLVVNKANFERMVSTQPQLIAKLTTLLAERIWFLYKQLANTLLTNPVARLYDGMLIHLEKLRVSIRDGTAYTFDFGPRELVNMVGLPQEKGLRAFQEILSSKIIRVLDDRIVVSDVAELEKQAKSYRKIERIERARKGIKTQDAF